MWQTPPRIHHEGTWCTISAHHAPPSVRNQILRAQDSPCSLSSCKHTSVSDLFPLVFLFFSFPTFLFLLVHILHIFYCLFCLSPCSRGASPTAADESTFLSAFSLTWPWDGPQDQTGGQHLCFLIIPPPPPPPEQNHNFSPTSWSWSVDVRRTEA